MASPSSEETNGPAPQPAAARRLGRDEIILIALLGLTAVGVAVSEISPPDAFRYWLAMVPVFGGVSLFGGWTRARAQGMTAFGVLRSQLLHWLALAVAVCLVFLLEATGRMGGEDAALVTLLALALTTFLAGVHFDWRYCVVGALLAAAVAAVALVQELRWLIVLAAVAVAVGLVVRSRRGGSGSAGR